MATNVIMPALEMAQESGVLVNWLKKDGELVTKGEPLMEIETDKVTVEIEAPASGMLRGILAHEGDVVPVGQTIAWILEQGEPLPSLPANQASGRKIGNLPTDNGAKSQQPEASSNNNSVEVSPLARNIAEENNIDLSLFAPSGRRIEKADVIAFLQEQKKTALNNVADKNPSNVVPTRILASPKARRLAAESGHNLAVISGSGPDGAVLAADVMQFSERKRPDKIEAPGTIWRLMAEQMTRSWTTVPHFYLMREVEAGRMVEWRNHISSMVEEKTQIKLTYTDLLVKLIAAALSQHPRLNAAWSGAGIVWNQEINIGIATAVEQGLVVPVIHSANIASVSEIAAQRSDLVSKAQNRKLRPADIDGGTFTFSNLGMYNVDSFTAIVNTPQAAILAVGRIADRIVPLGGQPTVKPMMTLSLSCDHRVVDGARAAQFLDDLSKLIEDPWRMLS